MSVRTPGAGLPARPRLLLPTLAVLAVLLLLAGVGVSLYTDLLWFSDVGFPQVFTTVLRTRLLLFVGFGALMATAIGANITVAYRVRPPFRPMSLEQQNLERYRVAVEPFLVPVLLLGSGVFGVFAGLSASNRWQTFLLWRNRTSFGTVDEQFKRDVSYYAMTYPFQRFVLGFLITAVVLSLLAAAATHYLFGGVRLQTAGDKVSPAARAHLSVLVGLLLLLKAAAYYLDRFGLAFSTRGRVQGASFTDVNAVLPAKNVLIGVAIICALLAFANIVVRNILLPAGAVALLVVTAVVFGGVYPAYTQQFRVKPNEIQRESPFIKRNIDATRAAYSIDAVQGVPYAATGTATTAVRNDQGTIGNARLLDPNVVSRTFKQLQRQRAYFGFNPSLDIDRYDLGDGLRDYVVGVRELSLDGLTGDQNNWINEHLIYTHGNGIVLAPANQVVDGEPDFVVRNLPVVGPPAFRLTEPRIYFGEGTTDYSVVATRQEETDGPISGGSDAPSYTYDGPGGVTLSNPLRKIAYALKFREKNLLLSGQIDAKSKLQYIRTPRERVQKVAPFLELDEDPYPAVVDGRILWIVDGYTTSAGYPYSERTTLGAAVQDSQNRGPQLPAEEVNYIRNSVKATVDAFTGQVKLYTFDEKDPVLKTWAKVFGNVLQPKSAIPPELAKHFRYPEDLFKVQRELLSKYHIQDAQQFFQGDDYWQIPGDPASSASNEQQQQPTAAPAGQAGALLTSEGRLLDQPPYYVVQQFPGTAKSSFNLTSTFVARNGQNLTAVASVSGDPGADYGKIRLLELPTNRNVEGPRQIAARFNSDATIRQVLFTLEQGNSTAIPGNLLTLPVGDGLLYVLPIYVRAAGNDSFPTLQVVLGAFGGQVESGQNFAETLNKLFGRAGATVRATGRPSPGASTRPAAAPSVQALIDAASQAFEEGQQALRKGDLVAYGQAQNKLQTALDRLTAAAGSGRASTPRVAAGPSASPSPAG